MTGNCEISQSICDYIYISYLFAHLARKSSGEDINLRWQGVDTCDVSDKLATRKVMLKNLHTVRITLNL